MDFRFELAFLILVVYFLIDVLYTKFICYVTNKQPIMAANTSTALYLLMAFGTINFIDNKLYLIPMVIGSWLGTFVVVWRSIEKKPNLFSQGNKENIRRWLMEKTSAPLCYCNKPCKLHDDIDMFKWLCPDDKCNFYDYEDKYNL